MARRQTDSFSHYDDLLAGASISDPWAHAAAETPAYEPDYHLLGELLSVPVRANALSESGIFAKGIDSWIAHELRRSGFGADEVWPRPQRPRVLPRDIAILLEKLPAEPRADLATRIAPSCRGARRRPHSRPCVR